jgi:hypothetical protein
LISLFLYGRVNTRHMPDESNVQEREVEKRLAEQRKLLIRTLDEKYHEDIISYQDMAKRLELEKKKVRTLETDLRSKKE